MILYVFEMYFYLICLVQDSILNFILDIRLHIKIFTLDIGICNQMRFPSELIFRNIFATTFNISQL